MKRYLDCSASELKAMNKLELLDSIASSEGRIIVNETIGAMQPMLHTITNAEFAASQGADLILLNVFDVNNPIIQGLPKELEVEDIIKTLQHLTGRIIGVNLEPVDFENKNLSQELWDIQPGRIATAENAMKLVKMGARFLVLTGNPGNKITNSKINHSLQEIKNAVGDELILMAGKMHAAGILAESSQKIITKKDISEFVENGADIILLPAPGTVPGITLEYARELVNFAHDLGVLTMTTIGTSQEGADVDTIRQIALMCKMSGTDLHHLGDTGYMGIALPENIMAYSIAIRGRRHTYSRMARSINR